ncbi:MAG TPA: carbohydrate-binding domain-containing protein [Bacteroidales bacterium]|nr:carbohydrate-binding domain-containing protein [Bacteroidales bacterium]
MMRKLLLLILMLYALRVAAQRVFVHPGIGYTQADIDRMKAMVIAKQEPFYSSFQRLKSDTYSSITRTARTWNGSLDKDGYAIGSSATSAIGFDGRCAVQYALIWKITGDNTYADKAISFLNSYKKVRSVNILGTAPLDNGKIYLLIEAAELMRDYPGWLPADQQAFRNMLTYPRYSSKLDMNKQICPETGVTYAYWDSQHLDTLNRVSYYWTIFNGDPGRHGNQGLFAMRGLMAMGIYLDNDTIYDRAYRKFLSLPHHSYDLPYPSGPPIQGARNATSSTQWYDTYSTLSAAGTGPIVDYGYNDELKYYIFENGQMQESSRDQNHAVVGIVMAENIAHMAWSQGDDIYTQYDNRLLKGINWTWKYNYSWYNNQVCNQLYWSGEDVWEPTVASGEFMVQSDRTGRWRSLKVNPYSENPSTNVSNWSRGELAQLQTQMLMQYKVRQGVDGDSLLWLQRAYDILMDSLGYENGYTNTGHSYEFLGWGSLLDYRTVWMAGDGGHFSSGQFVPGLPSTPCTIQAVDYDFFSHRLSGEGRTFHNRGTRSETNYRKEGGMDIAAGNGGFVLTALKDGEWMQYTITNAVKGWYQILATVKVYGEGASLEMSVDNGTEQIKTLTANTDFETVKLGKLLLPAGAFVLRLKVHGADDLIQLSDLRIATTTVDSIVPEYVWNSRDYSPVSGSGCFLTDQSDKLLTSSSYTNLTTATFAMNMDQVAYQVNTSGLYLVMHGHNLEHALFKNATYRLPDSESDVVKSSTGGQVPTWAHLGLGSAKDESFLIWKLDSSANSRIIPLLKSCYTGGYSSYILKNLSFLVYGSNIHRNAVVDDINFYTPTSILNAYPQLAGTPVTLKTIKNSAGTQDHGILFDLNGRKVGTLYEHRDLESTLHSLPKGVYLLDGKKISLH